MRSDHHLLMLAVGTAAMAIGGCTLSQRTTIDTPAAVQFPGDGDSLNFWDALEVQPVTTNDDALHGLLLLVRQEPPATNWEERVAAARALGWIQDDQEPPAPFESAEMGFVAVCLCHVLNVQGGLSLRLWGRVPRYCTRELVHMGLLPGITEHEALSGAEFIALLGNAEQRQLIDRAWTARTIEPPAAASSGEGSAPAPDTPANDPPSEPAADDEPPAGEGEATS
jgi:hypothetical protein